MTKCFFKLLVGMIIFINASAFGQSSKLKIEICGFEKIEGKVSIGLFNKPENFPKRSENNFGVHLEICDSCVVHTFTNLEKGEYAIAVYHDENSNGKLDRNFIGMPSEDYVLSNYATGTFGPPSFEDAKISLADSLELVLDLSK